MEQFKPGDTVYLINQSYIKPLSRENQFDLEAVHIEASECIQQALDRGLNVDLPLEIINYDVEDHTLKAQYTGIDDNRFVTYWMYAERFTKNSFLHNFKQIINE